MGPDCKSGSFYPPATTTKPIFLLHETGDYTIFFIHFTAAGFTLFGY